LAGTGSAWADPDFALVEAEARAGDVVHFAITGAKGNVTYELEIGHHDVIEDAVGAGTLVAGEFVMPHLGDSPKTVTVEAEMREPRDRTKVKRKLRYLGPAMAATRPAQVESAPSPPASQPPAAAPPPAAESPAAQPPAPAPPPAVAVGPERAHTVQGITTPRSRTRATRRRSARRGKRGKVHARRAAPRADRRHGRKPARKQARSRRPGARTAPLFDGIPEPGAGKGSAGGDGAFSTLNAIAHAAATLTGARTGAGAGDGLNAAVLVPGLMGVAALVLAGTAVHRRRRLR
jgi:hypothetical protein